MITRCLYCFPKRNQNLKRLARCGVWKVILCAPEVHFINAFLVKVRQIYYLFFSFFPGELLSSYKTSWSCILQLNNAFRCFNTAAKITAKTKGFRFFSLGRGIFWNLWREKRISRVCLPHRISSQLGFGGILCSILLSIDFLKCSFMSENRWELIFSVVKK